MLLAFLLFEVPSGALPYESGNLGLELNIHILRRNFRRDLE
jgi:hypothetical protein